MSGLNVGVKSPEYAEYIEKVYELLSDEDKEMIIKTEIYACCRPSPEAQKEYQDYCKAHPEYEDREGWNHEYEIGKFVSRQSNRTKHGNAQHVATALRIAMGVYPFSFLPMDEEVDYICKKCGYKFRTAVKRPRCQFCGAF